MYLCYCNLVWGSTYKSNLKRLTILQKRAIRIVSRSACDAHTDPIFKELRFLKTKGIHLLQLGQFMYSFSTRNLPTKLDSFFSVNNSIYMLFTGWEVRIGKNCARSLEYGPRPQAEGRTRDRGHSFFQYGPTKAGE